MNPHVLVYMALAAAYCEAAIASLLERQWHSACREAIVAMLYGSIALMVLDPAFLPIGSTLAA
jgi:hypothetical protein